MWKVITALAAVASLACTASIKAQEWPSRPITMINPFAAGGPNDVLARLFAQRMGEILGQSIVIENVGGAGGTAPTGSRKAPPTATPSCSAPSARRRRTRRCSRNPPIIRRRISLLSP